jgi:hypothetical protein
MSAELSLIQIAENLLAEATGAGAGSMEGKWFAETAADALEWGQRLNNSVGAVISVRVPTNLAGQLHRIPKLDGIGPARFANGDQLAQFPRAVGWR